MTSRIMEMLSASMTLRVEITLAALFGIAVLLLAGIQLARLIRSSAFHRFAVFESACFCFI